MITFSGSVFHIRSADTSYMFRVTKYGGLEHGYFGPAAAGDDAEALFVRPGTGWGSAVLRQEGAPESCPDTLPLEWSGAGRGDYRESPVELETPLGPAASEFVFKDYEIIEGTVKMKSGLPQAGTGGETLKITLQDAAVGAELYLYWTLFDSVLTRRAEIKNVGGETLFVTKLMSCCLDLAGEYQMTGFNGGWIGETHAQTVPVGGAGLVNMSATGFSSNRHNPGFLLAENGAGEDHGRVYGFNLVYSGNHYAGVGRSAQGLTRVMQGISPAQLRISLAPGESFETPEAVLAFSNRGYNGLSKKMHGFVNDHIVPPAWRYRARPVLFNDWEGCLFKFDEGRLMSLAKKAKKLGCELFVLDDGWFGARDNDRAGLGDYDVNLKKLPRGLKGLGDKLKALGLDFGLWFEPESVNPDSELYRAHPDWVLDWPEREPLLSRHQLLLDLTKPQVRDYIVSSVSAVLDSADIKYVKWDMNRHSPALGLKAHEYVLGLYDVLRRIFSPRPEILLESCASGGGRFDLGMLCFSPQIWASDNTDPIERLDIQKGLSYLYPQSALGCHVADAPHAQTLRETPLSTRGNAAFFGALGYELDLDDLLPVERAEIKAQIEFYKAHRMTFQFGTFSRLVPPGDGECWMAAGEKELAVGLFHRLVHAAPGYETLLVPGLGANKRYRIKSRPQLLRVGAFGRLLKFISPVSLSPRGLVMRTADSLLPMRDGGEDMTVSGGALAGGIPLTPLFSGTGYSEDIRVQGDFGSNIYMIEERP